MNKTLFEKLISSSESSTLDFKKEQYKIINGKREDDDKLIKDVIAFCNTERKESAYIIIGVDEVDGEKKLIGINEVIDDSIFQQKVSSKITPRPIFTCETFFYNNLKFCVLEFPLVSYSSPLSPTIIGKGIRPGAIYHRRGSANHEANGVESIRINEWITKKRFSDTNDNNSEREINNFLRLLNNGNERLSNILIEGLSFAKKNKHYDIESFCFNELSGYTSESIEGNIPHYRSIDVFISYNKINSAKTFVSNISQVWDEMEKSEEFFPYSFIYPNKVIDIEGKLFSNDVDPNASMWTVESNSVDFHFWKHRKPSFKVYVYFNYQILMNVYNSIKKKYVDVLMDKLKNE